MKKSKKLFNEAQKNIPSGVNSPVRFFEPFPFFVKKAKNQKIWDEDGNCYIDFCNGYGSVLLGHLRHEVISKVKNQLTKGTIYGTPSEGEIELAKLIKKNYPSMGKVRLVNTGGEATMTAIRLARGFTKKNKIIKFEGCYHGAHDSMLVKAGSGQAHQGISVSEGIPKESTKNTIVVQYNNINEIKNVIETQDDIAGVIVEPVLANMGLIVPQNNFLKDLRNITARNKIPLIFDEIVTGFRLAPGGAQEFFKIKPDITTLGKALGNGFTIAAVGGKKGIMDQLSPGGNVYEASTFAGNPISVSASIASVKTIMKLKNKIYPKLGKFCTNLVENISESGTRSKLDFQINSIGPMFQIFFSKKPVIDYQTSKKSNSKYFDSLFRNLLKRGIFTAPSQFETVFLSYSHTEKDIKKTMSSYEKSLRTILN